MDNARARLDALLARYAETEKQGFRIDLEHAAGEWDAAIRAVGIKAAYAHMASRLCRGYAARFGEEFLFGDACVCYEIEYHTDAYMCAIGRRGYRRNITSYLFSYGSLRKHCGVIDISTADVYNRKQRLLFGYRKGVRAVYRRTEKDPFYKPGTNRRTLCPAKPQSPHSPP